MHDSADPYRGTAPDPPADRHEAELEEILVLRHTYTASGPRPAEILTAEVMLDSRRGHASTRRSVESTTILAVFMADGGRLGRRTQPCTAGA